jgi:hypothetical protein
MAQAKARINLLFLCGRHVRIADDDGLTAAMRQAGGGVLPGHRTREPKTFLDRHIRRHSDAADCRPARGVVDDDDGLQTDRGAVDMNDAGGAELVGNLEEVPHGLYVLTLRIQDRRSPRAEIGSPCRR